MNLMYNYIDLRIEIYLGCRWDIDWVDWSLMFMGRYMDSCLIISLFSTFLLTVGFSRAKASVFPCIFDYVLMNEVVKGGVFEFIGCRRMKNWILLCESHQNLF